MILKMYTSFKFIHYLVFLIILQQIYVKINCNWLPNIDNYSSRSSIICVDIPNNFTMCKDIGYAKMRLPNLFAHETLQEAYQQTIGWIPLLKLGCHPKTKLFLCSLFTPVCLEQAIPPCRSLCESVKNSCLPHMIQHGFPWPRVVDCNQYPLDNGMCIKPQLRKNHSLVNLSKKLNQSKNYNRKINHLTRTRLIIYEILNSYCESDWILKAKISFNRSLENNFLLLQVHNYTLLKGEFSNDQQKILPILLKENNWIQLFLDFKNQSKINKNNKKNNLFKLTRKSTFILIGKTIKDENGYFEKLTLLFPLYNNRYSFLKKLFKKLKTNQIDCDDEPIIEASQKATTNLNSILYFEDQSNEKLDNEHQI